MTKEQIFTNNGEWVKAKLSKDEDYFKNLSKGQSPAFLYIGCSDSRVTAESLMGAGPGDVFVHRNIANLVPPIDVNSHSVIEYAVRHLKVDNIVVCGHYYCGGVKAAMQPSSLGIMDPWLANIRDVARLHQVELDGIADENAKYNRLIELNVLEQCLNVSKLAVVQEAFNNRNIQLHGWVFDIGSGQLIDLKFNLKERIEAIMEIYRLD